MLFTFGRLTRLLGFFLLTTSAASTFAQAKDFDYYVMSLSWSPEFCASRPSDRQCGRGYGLVLHGVWPQYNKGYPESCSNERMAAKTLRNFQGLFPSERLAFHEWKKHGTCSGLSPKAYLELSQALKQRVVPPKQLENLDQPLRVSSKALTQLILTSNPTLTADAIALTCKDSGRFLQEILVCFDKSAQNAIACGTDVQRRSQKSCGQDDFLVRNIR